MTKEIKTKSGIVFLVDDEDYEYLNSFSWHVTGGYAQRTERKGFIRKSFYMHREIMNPKNGLR